MNENDYAELFGVKLERGTEQNDGTEGMNAESVDAEGAESTEGMSAEGAESAEGTDAEGTGEQEAAEPAEQSREDNRRYAAARRKAEAERDAEIQRVKQEAQAEIDKVFEDMGLENPYTHEPIRTKADYEAYKAEDDKRKRANMAKKAEMNEEEFQQFVDDLPEVKEAKKSAAEAKRQADRQRFDADLKELGQLDPNIRTFEDVQKMDNFDEFTRLVMNGLSMPQAYKVLNYGKISEKEAQARQRAANRESTAHMRATRQRGTGALSVSPEEQELFSSFGIGRDEAERYINKHKRRN